MPSSWSHFVFLFCISTDDTSTTSSSYLHGNNAVTVRHLAKRSLVKKMKERERVTRPNREKRTSGKTVKRKERTFKLDQDIELF